MLRWDKQAILLITIIFSYGGISISSIAGEIKSNNFNFEPNSLEVKYPESNQLSSMKSRGCQALNVDFQEVYGFETKNYYIEICQKDDSYYYYRQSKLDANNSMIIPAQTVFGGNVFKATSGKTVYFVGKDGTRYYSSVMSNNNEIVLEPALLPTPSSFSQDIVNSGVKFSFGDIKFNKINQAKNTYPQPKYPVNEYEHTYALVCIQDNSDLNIEFDDWHNLLGKSTAVANKYATSNGHDFIYNDVFPDRAMIKTKEGKIVNLNITTTNEVIEQVCIRALEDI